MMMSQGSGERTARTRVVYIVGASHSGSTLLDLLLNAHSKMLSVGELKKFGPKTLNGKRPCSCGRMPLDGCGFWPEVVRRLGREGIEAEAIDADRGSPQANAALLRAVSDAGGGAIVVDSSKLARRLDMLQSAPDLDVLPVFLVRDPRGQVLSTMRKGESLFRAIRSYNLINRRIRRVLAGRRHVMLTYEALVRDPETAIAPILSPLGLEFEAAQLDWAAARKHSLGGNRMRHDRESRIKVDDRWRRELSWWQRAAIMAGTWKVRSDLAKLRA